MAMANGITELSFPAPAILFLIIKSIRQSIKAIAAVVALYFDSRFIICVSIFPVGKIAIGQHDERRRYGVRPFARESCGAVIKRVSYFSFLPFRRAFIIHPPRRKVNTLPTFFYKVFFGFL